MQIYNSSTKLIFLSLIISLHVSETKMTEFLKPGNGRSWRAAVVDFVTFVRWTDVIIVFDSSVPFKERHLLTSELAKRQVGSIALQVNDSKDDVISDVISAISTTFTRFVVFCVKAGTVNKLFEKASQKDLLHSDYEWLIVGRGQPTSALLSSLHGTSNVAMLIPKSRDDGLFLADNSCKGSTTASPIGLNNPNIFYSKNSEFVLCTFDGYGNNSGFVPVGFWTPTSGLNLTLDVIYSTVSRHFHNATFRVGVWEALPFLKRVQLEGGLKYEGFCMDVLDEMARVLNFNYELLEPEDGQYGAPDGNGSWNGMVGMLIRGEIDLAIGPITITPDRKLVVDFTVPYMEDGGGILTKGGDPGLDMMNMFRPFPLEVWLVTGAAIFVTGFILYVITRAADHTLFFTNSDTDAHDAGRVPWTLKECLLIIFGSLMCQGAPRHPRSSAGRLVLGCWWLFTILIVSIYTATLAAILTVTVNTDIIDSIDDLARSSLEPITLSGSNWHTMFLTANSGVYHQIGKRLSPIRTARIDSDVLPLVLEGKAAYVVDVNQVRYLYNKDCRNLHMAKTIFSNNGLGFALPRHAYYRNALNHVILRLQEGGFLEFWRQRWWPASPDCGPQGPKVSPARQLDVLSLGGLLLLYAMVVGISCLVQVLQMVLTNSRVHGVLEKCQSFFLRRSIQQRRG